LAPREAEIPEVQNLHLMQKFGRLKNLQLKMQNSLKTKLGPKGSLPTESGRSA
jgi:hypothetical protein